MIAWLKKYWKIILGAVLAVGGFIVGLLAGSRRPDIPSVSGNSPGASGHETADRINSERLASNIGKADGQLSGIADDNRRASTENNRITDDNKRLDDLAGKLDDLAR